VRVSGTAGGPTRSALAPAPPRSLPTRPMLRAADATPSAGGSHAIGHAIGPGIVARDARPRVLPTWRATASRRAPVHHALRVQCRAAHCSCLTRSVSPALRVLQSHLLQSHLLQSHLLQSHLLQSHLLQSQYRHPACCTPASRGAAIPRCGRLVQYRRPLRRSLSTAARRRRILGRSTRGRLAEYRATQVPLSPPGSSRSLRCCLAHGQTRRRRQRPQRSATPQVSDPNGGLVSEPAHPIAGSARR
jgi:hypothetical protein